VHARAAALSTVLQAQDAGAADKLFATLDTRIRAVAAAADSPAPSGSPGAASSGAVPCAAPPPVLLVDTVGFIQGLPHALVAAFQATLDEALDADVLVRCGRRRQHVVDSRMACWLRRWWPRSRRRSTRRSARMCWCAATVLISIPSGPVSHADCVACR
jgi:50S ribosomal subunit-associated GTPase HflX